MGFNESYRGTPPWDIGSPQQVFVDLEKQGKIKGKVLDVGCGTGENVLFLAKKGYPVIGIDLAELAIEKANRKKKDNGMLVDFLLYNALELTKMDQKFDTIIDSGVFHIFNEQDRMEYINNLASVLNPSGFYYMVCFSDKEPGEWGPRRITKDEIINSFDRNWKIISIDETKFEIKMKDKTWVWGWLATIERE